MLELKMDHQPEARMTDGPYNFGPISRVDADAVGAPGQRTFRLLVTGGEGMALLWLEKEELQALAVAIDQMLARLSRKPEWKFYGTTIEPYEPPEETVATPGVEFKVGQLSLGYDSDRKMFVLMAHDPEDDPEGPPTFTCLVTSSQLRTLSRRITSVVVGGRPRCTLCGDPIEPEGHVCVRLN
jgi:uncharacterized repeat protein (TIGR03847 family)